MKKPKKKPKKNQKKKCADGKKGRKGKIKEQILDISALVVAIATFLSALRTIADFVFLVLLFFQ